jgi:hypothetical protein
LAPDQREVVNRPSRQLSSRREARGKKKNKMLFVHLQKVHASLHRSFQSNEYRLLVLIWKVATTPGIRINRQAASTTCSKTSANRDLERPRTTIARIGGEPEGSVGAIGSIRIWAAGQRRCRRGQMQECRPTVPIHSHSSHPSFNRPNPHSRNRTHT